MMGWGKGARDAEARLAARSSARGDRGHGSARWCGRRESAGRSRRCHGVHGGCQLAPGANLVNPDARTDPNVGLFTHSGLELQSPPDDPITWAEWSAATATSRVSTVGGPDGRRTDVRISMQGLVPNGLYSIFWLTLEPDSENSLCPGVERLLPLDAFKPDALAPDPSSFLSDGIGSAAFHGRVGGHLLAATSLYFVVIYHSDGSTYYPLPNRGEFHTQGPGCRSSFGVDALRHLVIVQN